MPHPSTGQPEDKDNAQVIGDYKIFSDTNGVMMMTMMVAIIIMMIYDYHLSDIVFIDTNGRDDVDDIAMFALLGKQDTFLLNDNDIGQVSDTWGHESHVIHEKVVNPVAVL